MFNLNGFESFSKYLRNDGLYDLTDSIADMCESLGQRVETYCVCNSELHFNSNVLLIVPAQRYEKPEGAPSIKHHIYIRNDTHEISKEIKKIIKEHDCYKNPDLCIA